MGHYSSCLPGPRRIVHIFSCSKVVWRIWSPRQKQCRVNGDAIINHPRGFCGSVPLSLCKSVSMYNIVPKSPPEHQCLIFKIKQVLNELFVRLSWLEFQMDLLPGLPIYPSIIYLTPPEDFLPDSMSTRTVNWSSSYRWTIRELKRIFVNKGITRWKTVRVAIHPSSWWRTFFKFIAVRGRGRQRAKVINKCSSLLPNYFA